jgi:hypothetical protein
MNLVPLIAWGVNDDLDVDESLEKLGGKPNRLGFFWVVDCSSSIEISKSS